MRVFSTFLVLTFSCLTTYGQNYSKVVSDTSVIRFMTWLFNSDTSFHAKRYVDNDIIKLQPENFIYADSTTLSNYLYAYNIFKYEKRLAKYFDEKDAKYFVEQVGNQKKNKWQLNVDTIKLYDTIQFVNNRVDKVLYSYSLPIFSLNGNYVIIVEAFYCGLVCGGGDYNLYEKQPDNSWMKIKQFNHWDE